MRKELAHLTDATDVVARTVFGEARGEGDAGMRAVANVIMNRANNPRWWGRTIISVCLKPWQFSPWNARDPNLPLILRVSEADAVFRQALDIARIAVLGRLADNTRNADHFHAVSMRHPPRWARGIEPVAVIGHHRFFRLELPPPREPGPVA